MKKNKNVYLSPETVTLVVQTEGCFCVSADAWREGSGGDYSGDTFENGDY